MGGERGTHVMITLRVVFRSPSWVRVISIDRELIDIYGNRLFLDLNAIFDVDQIVKLADGVRSKLESDIAI